MDCDFEEKLGLFRRKKKKKKELQHYKGDIIKVGQRGDKDLLYKEETMKERRTN